MKKLKRIISAIVLTSITITLFQTNSIYADNMDGTPDGQADVDQNYKNPTGESGWNSLWQGYRFYIVDRNFNLVSSILDMTAKDPMLQMLGYEQYMYDSIATEELNVVGERQWKKITWEQVESMIPTMPNSPMMALYEVNGKLEAQQGLFQ